MSILAVTVIDQQKPWLMPRRTFATTIQPQDGAQRIMNGMGRATNQPQIRTRRRPTRSDRRPETKFIAPFTIPNDTMKAKIAVIEP